MPTTYESFVSPATTTPTVGDLTALWPSDRVPVRYVDRDRATLAAEHRLVDVGVIYIERAGEPAEGALELHFSRIESLDDIADGWCEPDSNAWRVDAPDSLRIEGALGYHTGSEISALSDLALGVVGALLPGTMAQDVDGEVRALDGQLAAAIATLPDAVDSPPPQRSFRARLFGR